MTGIGKKPSSTMKSNNIELGSDPAMFSPLRTSIHLPYDHYALIFLDNMGKLRVAESPSIRHHHATIFTPDVRDNFLRTLGRKIGHQEPLIHIKQMALQIGDSDRLRQYYTTALTHFQQFNCRIIAKAFIRFIEPRKQVKHPYNGRPRRGAPPGTKADPEKTKPEWWPAGMAHREPDHLNKNDRISLLIHIMRQLGAIGATADVLLDIVYDCGRQFDKPEKFNIIEEIFKVRKMEERYERGEMNASTIVYVMDHKAHTNSDKDAYSFAESELKLEPEEPTEMEEVEAPFAAVPSNMPVLCTMPSIGENLNDYLNVEFNTSVANVDTRSEA
ncbi:hypothetical protein BO71DRAFT_429774 [Aspergillus ellipticus CBS 707.79]|uniref:Subtelomeric hrmA-associated cluster protein AFUB-079030/YDR124W-like helical bundle domain-containing protein n=1 Tax=Aspergillus ellipticus CBS 707.79 TaxID=1448320 RepID=A0A319DB99_9EURO|nr:hypothetical protein BO71DRAFT_429774 [Aspergillus ellipticus CBS 707.79]